MSATNNGEESAFSKAAMEAALNVIANPALRTAKVPGRREYQVCRAPTGKRDPAGTIMTVEVERQRFAVVRARSS